MKLIKFALLIILTSNYINAGFEKIKKASHKPSCCISFDPKDGIWRPENLCYSCQFKRLAYKRITCPFCRRQNLNSHPQSILMSCRHCVTAIRDELCRELNIPASNAILREAVITALSEAYYKKNQGRLCIDELNEFEARIKIFNYRSFPGIYLGAMLTTSGATLHLWSPSITIKPEDKNDNPITSGNLPEWIDFIVEKYKIFGPETGAIVELDSIPTDVVTYEEKE